jgi:RecA/RadA recombinase
MKTNTKKTTLSGNDFLKRYIKVSGNTMSSLMSEETLSNTTDWIDTGSHALNGLLSANIFNGVPNNKVIAFAGEESVGKTFFVLNIAKQAIEAGYNILYFDTENSTEKDMVVKRNIDPSKILYLPVETVEDFRDQLVKIVDDYNDKKQNGEECPKLMIILDSLGNTSTRKEIKDVETGNDKQDMTRSKVVKSIFRVLNIKLAKAKIPMLITNHVYADMSSFVPKKIMSSGCLTKDAMVLMHNKKYKNINKIFPGDIVQTLTGKKEVLNTFYYQEKEIVTFKLENGDTINCTENHKFLIENDSGFIWKKAKDINENDYILFKEKSKNHNLKQVKIIKKIRNKKEDVYDIEVKDAHHYILKNGIISHNSGPKYAASIIIFISKAKAKDSDGRVIGSFLSCTTVKNRFCKDNTKIKLYLDYKKGLHPYYGLEEFGSPILNKESKGWSLNGEKITEKQLWSMEWPKELLDKCNENINKLFSFGDANIQDDTDLSEVEVDTEE